MNGEAASGRLKCVPQGSPQCYQTIRMPVWIRRGVLACVEIIPKLEAVGTSWGAPKVTWFVRLKTSKRNCRYLVPSAVKLNFFSSDMSRFLVGSRRRLLNVVSKVRMKNCG